MKIFFNVFIIVFILTLVVACGGDNLPNNKENNENKELIDWENMKVDEKYYPKFIDVEEGKSLLKPLVYYSTGWSLYKAGNFLFATCSRYLLRYNIIENKIDNFIDLGEIHNGYYYSLSFSSNGKYLISSSQLFNGNVGNNYFLIDFDEQNVELILDIYDENKVEEVITKKIDKEVNEEINKTVLAFNYEKSDETLSIDVLSGTFNLENESIKLNTLQGMTYCGAYYIIDDKKIGLIMPIEPKSCELGYYKISIINVEEDIIVQEYILNKK
jgi:hypothetical protein